MSLLDFGRALLAEALRAAAERVSPDRPGPEVFEPDEPGNLVTPEAAELIAPQEGGVVIDHLAPAPRGSLADRAGRVGRRWAQ